MVSALEAEATGVGDVFKGVGAKGEIFRDIASRLTKRLYIS
jgi:hypothetical protein